MKCLNPACSSLSAHELNISVNMSETDPGDEVSYTGWTEYGDPSVLIATACYGDEDSCEATTYVPNWRDIVLTAVGPEHPHHHEPAELTS